MKLMYVGGPNPVITDIQSRIKGNTEAEIQNSLLTDISEGELETLIDWYEQIQKAEEQLRWGFSEN